MNSTIPGRLGSWTYGTTTNITRAASTIAATATTGLAFSLDRQTPRRPIEIRIIAVPAPQLTTAHGAYSSKMQNASPTRSTGATKEARTEPAGRQIGSTARSLTTENSFQLLFVHLRPALDSSLLGLVAKLVVGPAAGSQVRPQAAAPARRHVVDGRRTRLPGLAVAGTLLVDRPGGDLFGLVFASATLDQAFL